MTKNKKLIAVIRNGLRGSRAIAMTAVYLREFKIEYYTALACLKAKRPASGITYPHWVGTGAIEIYSTGAIGLELLGGRLVDVYEASRVLAANAMNRRLLAGEWSFHSAIN